MRGRPPPIEYRPPHPAKTAFPGRPYQSLNDSVLLSERPRLAQTYRTATTRNTVYTETSRKMERPAFVGLSACEMQKTATREWQQTVSTKTAAVIGPRT